MRLIFCLVVFGVTGLEDVETIVASLKIVDDIILFIKQGWYEVGEVVDLEDDCKSKFLSSTYWANYMSYERDFGDMS